jgi:hypothetical protein
MSGPSVLPSAARTIPLLSFAGTTPRGRQPVSLPLRWPPKQPADVLDYSLDATGFLADIEDQVVSVTATPLSVSAGDVAIASLAVAGGLVTAWLAGGQPDTDYTIEVAIATLAGRTMNAACLIYARAGLPVPSPPLPAPGPIIWTSAPDGLDFRVPSNLINAVLVL